MGEGHRPHHPTSRSEAPRGAAAGGTRPDGTTAGTTSAPGAAREVAEVARGADGAKTGIKRRARGAAGAAARPPAPALGNYADTPSDGATTAPAATADEVLVARVRRAERWWMLHGARKITGLDRLRQCRRVTVTGTGGPTMRTGARRGAGYAGLSTCASVWACPCCAGRIAARRAADLVAVMATVRLMGGCAYLVTFTVRHHRGHRLAPLWDAVTKGWSAVVDGGKLYADAPDLLGWCRVVEATHTPRSGWHLHVHALWCWAAPVDDVEAQRVALRAWRRWDAALRRAGFDSTPVRGVDARRVRLGADGSDDALGSYFTKIACEVTAQHAKDSRSGRSPFAILRDAVGTYRVEDLELWWEWERASHGRKQLTWSLGDRDLRRLAGVRDASDEELAAEDIGTEDVIALSGDAWDHIARGGHETELLDLAETSGIAAVTGWLDDRGLGWSPARRPPRRDGPRLSSPQTRREARAVLAPPG